LNDNLIQEIEPHTFLHKSNLSRVDLYANRITGLDIKALRLMPFSTEKNLPEFYIGGNPFVCDCNIEWLKAINDQNSRQYPRIMDIDTIYCKLLYNRDKSFIPLLEAQPHHFLCGYNLHCFTLCDCCGHDTCSCEMKCPTNCTCFHDQTWKTNIVECGASTYRDVPKKLSNDITELYLDGSNLVDLNENSFSGKKNLIIFYGNNSNIHTIHNGTFAHLQKLLILHMGSNKLQRLSGHEFNGLENLRELYLQHNKLSSIDVRTFQSLRKLEVLRLDDNKLSNYEIWRLADNKYLTVIALADNTWSCDCHYLNTLQIYLQSNTEKIIDLNRIACVYNNYTNVLKEKNGTICTLNNGMSSIVYAKQIEDLLPFLLVATCAFVGFFALVMGIFCYRRELKHFVHENCTQLFICCGYKSSEFLSDYNDKDRLYDAYVIYSLQDDNFVTQGLTNVLENDIGFRMCLHYRDFNLNVNNFIADTICEAIDNSKRAILVLSKNFLYNEWGRFEFKGAIHEVLKRRRKLIIILYGDIPQKDLDADIRLYLKSNLCIEWDDKKFWQKLRLALPSHVSKHNTNKHCRSTTNVYAAAPIYEGVHQQYPLRSHEYNTITPVNRVSTLRRGISGAASIRLDNYGPAVMNNCQQPKICDNYEQINNCKFNTLQTANEHHMNNINVRRIHEYAVPINCPSGGIVVDSKRTDNNNFECNNKYTSSTSSLSNGSSEFCTRSLSSPSNSRHCVDGYSNDSNINAEDVFNNKDQQRCDANINNLNNINCKTMPSNYYCGGGGVGQSNAKVGSNTMHHQQKMFGVGVGIGAGGGGGEKMNIIDENNMKNSSATTDKKRRLPQSDMMWA
jgi:TIR domain/Leucine rich repeat